MKLITIKDLDEWGACNRADGEKYSDENIKKLLGKRKGLTPLEITEMDQIPIDDRIWVLLRKDVLGDKLDSVVKKIVDYQVKKQCLKCGIKSVEEWAKNWLNGTDRTEAAACDAASAAGAAWDAARDAARDAQIDKLLTYFEVKD